MTVSRVEDWIAIRELTARYNRRLDEGRAAEWIETFTEDGVLDVVDTDQRWAGHADLLAFASAKPWGSMHLTMDAEITLEDDSARQVCALLMVHRSSDRDVPALMTTGRYEDVLRRTDAGWRFQTRAVTLHADIAGPALRQSTPTSTS